MMIRGQWRRGFILFLIVVVMGGLTFSASQSSKERLLALPSGTQPRDTRLGEPRTLNSYFPFVTVDSPESWKGRARRLRRQIQVATGLWPPPTKTPLKPVVHGRVLREEYTVEKVYFQSLPGFYVTGNLYRPRGKTGRLPAILSPHGHMGKEAIRYGNGRFHDNGTEDVRRKIAQGAERFEVGGRYPMQARAVQLVRMGCVVFQYDMVGYGDSVQLAHRGLGEWEPMSSRGRWGFSSPQAELRLQNLMGLQTWNSIRALDFLLSLPEVDPERVAVEGHSGGGTQTFLLCAIDERPAAAFAGVMVSTAMQGGCICENAPYLRIGAGNIDFAALSAPRPFGMTGADDWTLEITRKGFPELKELYAMLGYEARVHAVTFPQFGHNYNSVSRTVMYNWFNKHLNLGFEEPVIERDYQPLSRQEMSVWNAQHPQPSGEQMGDSLEGRLLERLAGDSQSMLNQLIPGDASSVAEYRRVVGGAWDVIIGRREEVAGLQFMVTQKIKRGDHLAVTGLLRHRPSKTELPILWWVPLQKWNRQVIIWLHGTGKQGLLDSDGNPKAEVARLLGSGFLVAGVDLLGQGEFLSEDDPVMGNRLVTSGDGSQPWDQFAAYTFGYNYPLFSQRVHDVLSLIHFFRTGSRKAERTHLLGFGPTAGPIAAAALAQTSGAVGKAAIDTAGFRFERLDRFDQPMFLPGAVKYGDVPGLLSLASAEQLWLAGEGAEAPRLLKAVLAVTGRQEQLSIFSGKPEQSIGAAVEWILSVSVAEIR